jgi:hypothetical protein
MKLKTDCCVLGCGAVQPGKSLRAGGSQLFQHFLEGLSGYIGHRGRAHARAWVLREGRLVSSPPPSV